MQELIRIATAKFPTLFVSQYGAENSPVIVLLHGFPADGSLWRNIIAVLAEKFRVLVPDLPGAGESTFAGEDVSIEELAAGIQALLKHLNIKTAIIAGHSMGGYIALAFAALFPQMVSGLSIIHSSAKADDEEKKEARRKSIDLIRKGGKEPFINAMIPALFAEQYRKIHPEVIEAQRQQALKVEDQTLIAFYNAMINRPDRQDVLGSATFPVQWVLGAEDNLASPEKVLQQTTLANVNFVTIYQNSGHMAILENPRQMAHDLGQFSIYCNARQTEDSLI